MKPVAASITMYLPPRKPNTSLLESLTPQKSKWGSKSLTPKVKTINPSPNNMTDNPKGQAPSGTCPRSATRGYPQDLRHVKPPPIS
ncbi:hypothetical protein BDQ17DRAFT_1378471, partial [Cyathus striatus]